MLVHTKPYGQIDVDERQKLFFPFGILGFENLKNYILIDAEQHPFYWLQSLDVSEIAFVLINPLIFRPDYTIDVPQEELDEIQIENEDDTLVLTIVTIPENQSNMTANLQGPIVINKKSKQGRQAITTNRKWGIRHRILEELSAVEG